MLYGYSLNFKCNFLCLGRYDPKGLAQAVEWLDKAKVLPHDSFQAILIEADLRSCFSQFEKAHHLLDQLPLCLETKVLRHGLLARELRQHEVERLSLEIMPLLQAEQQELIISEAWMYAHLNDTAKGIELLEQRLQSNPHDLWLKHTLSLFYWKLGDVKTSRAHNRAVLKINPLPLALDLQQELLKLRVFFARRLLFKTSLSLLLFTAGVRILT